MAKPASYCKRVRIMARGEPEEFVFSLRGRWPMTKVEGESEHPYDSSTPVLYYSSREEDLLARCGHLCAVSSQLSSNRGPPRPPSSSPRPPPLPVSPGCSLALARSETPVISLPHSFTHSFPPTHNSPLIKECHTRRTEGKGTQKWR